MKPSFKLKAIKFEALTSSLFYNIVVLQEYYKINITAAMRILSQKNKDNIFISFQSEASLHKFEKSPKS